jgi:hypothetical protein
MTKLLELFLRNKSAGSPSNKKFSAGWFAAITFGQWSASAIGILQAVASWVVGRR